MEHLATILFHSHPENELFPEHFTLIKIRFPPEVMVQRVIPFKLFGFLWDHFQLYHHTDAIKKTSYF